MYLLLQDSSPDAKQQRETLSTIRRIRRMIKGNIETRFKEFGRLAGLVVHMPHPSGSTVTVPLASLMHLVARGSTSDRDEQPAGVSIAPVRIPGETNAQLESRFRVIDQVFAENKARKRLMGVVARDSSFDCDEQPDDASDAPTRVPVETNAQIEARFKHVDYIFIKNKARKRLAKLMLGRRPRVPVLRA